MAHDLHNAPRVVEIAREVVECGDSATLNFVLLHLRSGKTTQWKSLHVSTTRLRMDRVTVLTFLRLLHFAEFSVCPATHDRCWAAEVPIVFDFSGFVDSFKGAAAQFVKSAALWEESQTADDSFPAWGDGHTGHHTKTLKRAAGDAFAYAFTYLKGEAVSGAWTTHCHPQVPPTVEVDAAMRFLALHEYMECPEFDFERCYYRITPQLNRDDTFMHDNSADAHKRFDALTTNLSGIVTALIAAHRLVEPFGFPLLPIRSTPVTVPSVVASPARPVTSPIPTHKYDMAVSFAGEQRALAERLANLVSAAGFVVFIDSSFRSYLWGKDLPVTLGEIYRDESRFCVIFVSAEYRDKMWTRHERRHAIERWMRDPTGDYILPVCVDGSSLEGFPGTVGYLSLTEFTIEQIATTFIEKLQAAKAATS